MNLQHFYQQLTEWHYKILNEVYENQQLKEYHILIQQIKTKFPIQQQQQVQFQYPNQDDIIQYFQNYEPIIIEMQQLYDVKIKLYKNAAYYGMMNDGLRHGLGILIKQTLQLYEGSFIKDKKEGIGFEILKNQQYYYGNYYNGLPHGEGVYYSKQQKYIGQWYQGRKHGIGFYQQNIGDYYLAQWENGKCCGLCLHIKNDIYIGYILNDLKHGQGKEYFENGDLFIGEYKNGKPNGKGEFQWNNGNQYKGEFANGLRNGYGIWISKTQNGLNTYKGEYVNDKKCGEGIFQYANGTKYSGYFQNDKRSGYGEMQWNDGAIYQGFWIDGLMDGEGLYQFDTLILKGVWKQNQILNYNNVKISLNQFPQQHNIKQQQQQLQEQQQYEQQYQYQDDDNQSQLAQEPDYQDEIGDQFQKETIVTIKNETNTQNISHNTSNHDMQFNKLPMLQKQFDLLSLLDQGLQVQSLQTTQRQSSSVAIQTENNKKQFLPKLSLNKKTPTQYSVDYGRRNTRFKFDSLSNSPNTRGTEQSNQLQKVSKKQTRSVQGRSIQGGRQRKNKQVLLSKKEQNIWAIKMNKLKLSPTKYNRLWNYEVVNEIKQFLYPPVWKPPSHPI